MAEISKAAVSRMPTYLKYLKGEAAKGVEYVSSADIAQAMNLSAVGVRKDLALVAPEAGKPRMGFEVKPLITEIETFLGYNRYTNAVIMGAGGLGRAILAYDGFENYGLNVVAAFDVSPSKIGAVGGKPVYPVERLPEIVKRQNIEMGILTVPRSAAQSACDLMVAAGIRAILNFAPVFLSVPSGVLVESQDLAASLAHLRGALVSE